VPDAQAPLVVYPIHFDPISVATIWRHETPAASLAALIGRTRANTLEAAISSGTTSELARRTGISPASASEHIGVLRQAGLIVTRRYRNTAHHTVTQLGRQLMASSARLSSAAWQGKPDPGRHEG
jgi:DNA-binding transcriptional ArsR family regulator